MGKSERTFLRFGWLRDDDRDQNSGSDWLWDPTLVIFPSAPLPALAAQASSSGTPVSFAPTVNLPSYTPSDSLFANEWHLKNTGQFGGTPGIDINVTPVWVDYTGAGVHVGVYDDGVEYTHPDLDGNYDASRQVIISGAVQNPVPQGASTYHGTSVAGVIAAENNGTGTVGVAFQASITGVNIFTLTSAQFDQAMGQEDNFDVVNHSWGWTEAFADSELDLGWSSFYAGVTDAIQNGRGGKGTIIVHAAGNDRTNQFNSGEARDANDSNFTNSRFVISVGAIDNTGSVAIYSTPGAAILVSAPSNGGTAGIWTTDRVGANGTNTGHDSATNDNAYPDYNGNFGGTSSASPTVAGVVALMLQANPNLGWRDVQEILAYSARHVGSTIGSNHTGYELYNWSFNGAADWNGGGLHFSNDYGFGMVDALAAVRLAESWTLTSTLTNETSFTISNVVPKAIPDNNPAGITYTFNVGTAISVEHVEVTFDMLLPHTQSGDLIITLTAPDGTVSTLLNRIGQNNGAGPGLPDDFNDWVLSSDAFRSELSTGTWTLKIVDAAAGNTGTIASTKLTLYGTSDTVNDNYIYTNEFALYAGTFGHSQTLTDTDGGTDTLNAAAVSTDSLINLNPGSSDQIAGKTLVMGAGIENAYGGDGNDTLIGTAGVNLLFGGHGNDILDGGGGADFLSGGTGDDIYFVDDAGDSVVESAGQGVDTVESAVSYVLGANVENLILLPGMGPLNGTGNALANAITGNSENNVLTGGGGNDTIAGGGGSDTAVFAGSSGQYAVAYSDASHTFTVTDQRSGSPDGTDTITGVEFFQFSNGTADVLDYASFTTPHTDGSRTVTTYDATDSLPWSTRVTDYDNAGRLTAQTYNEDNGTHWVNTFDAANTASWTWATANTDPNGALVSKLTTFDDGTHTLSVHDNLGTQGFADFTIAFDADWNLVSESGTHHNGTPLTNGEISAAYDSVVWFTHTVDPGRDLLFA